MIEFPNLLGGLNIPVQRIAFYIGSVPIYWYGIVISFAFILSVALGLKTCKKYDIKQNDIVDIALYATIAAIIGARLYYVAFSWSEFEGNLLNIINTRTGGLAIYGGVIGAFAAVFIVCKIKKIKALKILDFGVPYLVLGQAIGRWGNFFNQEAFGTNTTLPWGMKGDGITTSLSIMQQNGINVDPSLPIHPTFLYESLACLLIFVILVFARRRKKADGEVLALYLILYGAARFFIEGLRTDSLMLGSFRVSQVLSAALVAVFLAFFILIKVKNRKPKEPDEQEEYISILEEILESKKSKDAKASGDPEEKNNQDN
ncbi:MAG: prolipoprotein diacylglyceryl transferase [Clostridia bacterium]|jgi:phosphatidylglycerol:prolipoprotein diacylglycerol transferase